MAMICENVPAEHVGRQLGFAMSGVSIGLCVGPVLGGVLYDRMGWHAPFIFCIIICAFEFVGRLLIVERIEVRRWGIGLDEIFHDADGLPIEDDESAQARQRAEETAEAHPEGCVSETDGPRSGKEKMPLPDGLVSNAFEKSLTHTGDSVTHSSPNTRSEPKPKPKHLTPIQVLVKMSSSPRAMCAVGLMFSFSLIIGALDPTLPVRVKDVWDKDSLFIGIIYLVASIPTFLTGPLAGAAADKWGAQVVTAPCILLALPWFPSMQLKSSFAGFIIFFMLASKCTLSKRAKPPSPQLLDSPGLVADFSAVFVSINRPDASLSSFLSPVGLELAQVAQTQEGIGEIREWTAYFILFDASNKFTELLTFSIPLFILFIPRRPHHRSIRSNEHGFRHRIPHWSLHRWQYLRPCRERMVDPHLDLDGYPCVLYSTRVVFYRRSTARTVVFQHAQRKTGSNARRKRSGKRSRKKLWGCGTCGARIGNTS